MLTHTADSPVTASTIPASARPLDRLPSAADPLSALLFLLRLLGWHPFAGLPSRPPDPHQAGGSSRLQSQAHPALDPSSAPPSRVDLGKVTGLCALVSAEGPGSLVHV